MEIEKLDSFPSRENPFNYDFYHMGTYLGNNVLAMYGKFEREFQPYVILIDITTGERIKVTFTKE